LQKAGQTSSARSSDARALRSGAALRAALLVLLETTPFDQLTIRDICAQAGVHYATFFRHYAGKEQLLDAIAKDQIAQLNRLTLAIRGGSDYAAAFRALCVYVEQHRALWATLLNGGAGAAMREEWLRQSRDVAEHEAHASSWLPRDLGAICAASLIAETIAWWLGQPDGAYGIDELADILHRLLVHSLIEPR